MDSWLADRINGLAPMGERPALLSDQCLRKRCIECPEFIPLLKDGPLEPCECTCHGFVYDFPCGCP